MQLLGVKCNSYRRTHRLHEKSGTVLSLMACVEMPGTTGGALRVFCLGDRHLKNSGIPPYSPNEGAHQPLSFEVDPRGIFTYISITTPVPSALKKLLYLELSRSPNGNFKSLPDPGGGFTETATRRFQKRNGRYVTVSELKRLKIDNGHMQRPFPNGQKSPFGCHGYVRNGRGRWSNSAPLELYSGVGIFNFNCYYLSSPPQVLQASRAPLE